MPHRPSRTELLRAVDKTLPDIIAPELDVLFCGINPGLYSAAIGRHFGRPGNRFWPTLYRSGFTPRLLDPNEQRELLDFGCGITNVVERASAAADELSGAELKEGGALLVEKVKRYRPRALAVLGIGAYRSAFGRPTATIGLQPESIGATLLWVLPNPSGLNAHYGLRELAELFSELRRTLHGEKRASR